MPNACAAPNCRVGYEKNSDETIKVSRFHFPIDPDLRTKWINAVPRKDWVPSKNSVLCEKHFLDSDFKTEREDKNKARKKSKGTNLFRKSLKSGAIPSQWPDCPILLSKKQPSSRPTSRTSSSIREQAHILKEQLRIEKEKEEDSFHSLNDFDERYVNEHGLIISKNLDSRMIFSISIEGIPKINYCLKISDTFSFESWCNGVKIDPGRISKETGMISTSVNSFSKVDDILTFLNNEFVSKMPSEKEKMNTVVEQLLESFGDNKKVLFLAEQLSLVHSNPNARRYSSSLLGMSCMWETTSPAAYKQICSDNVLTLPHYKYLRSLTSAIGSDLKLSEPAKSYLAARASKLSRKEKCVSLILDEVHVQKNVQYTNGQFFGLENNEITKTLLCVMIKSVAGKYRDVVSMTPITNINHEKLRTIWENNMQVLFEIGFDVYLTMSDGHDSNVKFFRSLHEDGLKYSIQNPFATDKLVFLMFDPVHLFKNFYNNFMKAVTFTFPSFKFVDSIVPELLDGTMEASFLHIKNVHDIEIGKPLKLAFKLNEKVLNPAVIERTSVKLADSVFHESTINSLFYYSNNGYPQFKETALFLRMMRTWFNVLNVKSLFYGENVRDVSKLAIKREDPGKSMKFMKSFCEWLEKWKTGTGMKGLTRQTFGAATQTSNAHC